MQLGIRSSRARRTRGFTLMEAALATVIVGVGVLSTVELFAGLTQQTRIANHETTALFLANNAHELLGELSFDDPLTGSTTFGPESNETLTGVESGSRPFNDLDDFVGSFSPPIDSSRQPIEALSQYTQTISVTNVDPNRPTLASAGSACRRVTVVITYRPTASEGAQEVYRVSWLRVR
jgi:type II secretory pathway pseudopilin PulG